MESWHKIWRGVAPLLSDAALRALDDVNWATWLPTPYQPLL